MENNPTESPPPTPPDNNPSESGAAGQTFQPTVVAPAEPTTPAEPAPQPTAQPTVFEPVFAAQTADRPLGVTTGQPPQAGQVITSGAQVGKLPRRFRGKKILIPAAIVFVLLGGSAAAYFGYYLNTPANVWKTALIRTGQGYDQLSSYATSQFQSKYSGIKLDGNFKTSGLLAADGTVSGSSDKNGGEFTGSLSAGGLKLDGDVRLLKSSAGTPDIYFKVDGLQGLGDLLGSFGLPAASVTSLNGINGKWYFIDHSLFNELSGSSSSSLQVTSADVQSVLKAIGDAGKQNIFTSDTSKMAFTVKTYVGKEKRDGRNVYHYVAAVNKTNLKAYLTTLCNNLKNSNLKKFFNNDAQSVSSGIGCDTASSAVNNFDTNRTADVWVDLHTKLIHAVRLTDPNHKTNYFEIGQDYQGGSKFPFDLKTHSQDQSTTTDVTINLALDTNSNTFSLGGSANETSQDNSGNLNASFQLNISPNNTKVNVQTPPNAENILQLLNDLGVGQIFQGIQADAKDTERQTDISALQGHIEDYWADTGYYPTLANLNDPSWVAANFKGLDSAAFQDPDATSTKLAATPAAHVYAYQPGPAGCNDTTVPCTDYTLTATLDSGGTFVKQSDNSGNNSAFILQN